MPDHPGYDLSEICLGFGDFWTCCALKDGSFGPVFRTAFLGTTQARVRGDISAQGGPPDVCRTFQPIIEMVTSVSEVGDICITGGI